MLFNEFANLILFFYTVNLYSSNSGNAGDSMTRNNHMRFSTRDSDNDLSRQTNCGEVHEAGWWFNSCGDSNVNGIYHKFVVAYCVILLRLKNKNIVSLKKVVCCFFYKVFSLDNKILKCCLTYKIYITDL